MRCLDNRVEEHTPLACRFRRRAETLVWTQRCVQRDAGHRTRDAVRSPNHATSEIASGSKLGMDATKKLPGEGFKRPWPPLIKMDEAVKAKVERMFGGAM